VARSLGRREVVDGGDSEQVDVPAASVLARFNSDEPIQVGANRPPLVYALRSTFVSVAELGGVVDVVMGASEASTELSAMKIVASGRDRTVRKSICQPTANANDVAAGRVLGRVGLGQVIAVATP
jgi:hypothetical protein